MPKVNVRKHEVNNDLVNGAHEGEVGVVAMAEPVGEKDDVSWGEAKVTKFGNGVGDRVAGGLGRCDDAGLNMVLFCMSLHLGTVECGGRLGLNTFKHVPPQVPIALHVPMFA